MSKISAVIQILLLKFFRMLHVIRNPLCGYPIKKNIQIRQVLVPKPSKKRVDKLTQWMVNAIQISLSSMTIRYSMVVTAFATTIFNFS